MKMQTVNYEFFARTFCFARKVGYLILYPADGRHTSTNSAKFSNPIVV